MNTKKIRLYEKIINLILNILIGIFGVLLLIFIYNNIQIKILGNNYSSFFGYSTFEVQTGSMADTINPGDWIIVKQAKTINLEDIVTYEKNGEFITHRVIEAYKGTFVTRGDANVSKDEAISQDQIVGKVVKILPNFGFIRKTFFNPIVLMTFIFTLFVFSYVLKTTKKEEVKNKKVAKKENKMQTVLYELSSVLLKEEKEKEVSIKEDEQKNSDIKIELEPEEKILPKEKKNIINEIKSYLTKITKKNVKSKANKEVTKEVKEEKVETIEEVKEVKEIESTLEEEPIKEITEEEMDKTLFFRMVPVDKLELDNTYMKITENELKNDKKVLPNIIVDEETSDEIDEAEDDSLVNDQLELLQKKKKKFKNVIEKIIFIKKQEITEIIEILNKGEKNKTNEATIKEELLNTYINARYYNTFNYMVLDSNKNITSKIDSEIKAASEKLLKKYKGSDNKYGDKLERYTNIFILINNLEQIDSLIAEVVVKRESYKNKILKCFKTEALTALELKNMVNNILKKQRVYRSVNKYILNKLDTNTFELNLKKVQGRKPIYLAYVNHNIAFSKVYSDYIVDKTYSEGIIAEDKVMVLINLLLIQVVKDMLLGEFNNKYIIYVPESLYSKSNKLNKIFEMLIDEYAKNSVMILLDYNELIKNKKVIKSYRKEGYNFCVGLNETSVIKDKDVGNIYVANYLFMDKKITKTTNILQLIPEDIRDNIIYEDLLNELENFGGEE